MIAWFCNVRHHPTQRPSLRSLRRLGLKLLRAVRTTGDVLANLLGDLLAFEHSCLILALMLETLATGNSAGWAISGTERLKLQDRHGGKHAGSDGSHSRDNSCPAATLNSLNHSRNLATAARFPVVS